MFKYRFKIRIDGKQYKRIETCKESAAAVIYADWINEIRERLAQEEQIRKDKELKATVPRLFENFDKYLKYIDAVYAGKMARFSHTMIGYFKECFGDMELASFKRAHVNDYKAWREGQTKKRGGGPVSKRTVNREIAELSRFFTWAIEQEVYHKVNPCFRQKYKLNLQREVFLTPEQIDELMDRAKDEGDTIFMAVTIALSTGFRRGELFNLEWRDIDFRHSRIFLRASTTKNHKSRIVAVPDFLINYLAEKRELAQDKDGRIFEAWPTVEWLRKAFKRVRGRLSFNPLPNGTNLHFHDLRHVYAQCLRDQGVALQDISAFLGHSGVAVTERFYAQAGGKDAKQKVEKLAEVIPLHKVRAS